MYNSIKTLKAIDLYALNGWISWYVNYASVKLLFRQRMWGILFPPALLRYNWHITLHKFKVYSVMIWCTYRSQNIYHDKVSYHILHPRNYYFVVVVRRCKVYSLCNFHVYITVLLTLATTLYIRSPKFTHLTARNWYPMTNISLVPHLSPW